jgi:copper homeostasis protein
MSNEYLLEICANSVKSCVEAQKGGAYRVELCAGIPEGGTTPSYGDIILARQLLNIKLNVIIRPRGGDFLYDDLEHKIMLQDIKNAVNLGADGVVFGCLTADGDIDIKRNKELIEAAGDLSVTFHRAFDMCKDPFVALEKIIELGFDKYLLQVKSQKRRKVSVFLKN